MNVLNLITKEIKDVIRDDLLSIQLHGSYLYNEMHKHSDYDIYVVTKETKNDYLKELNKRILELEKKIGNPIVVSIITENQLPEKRKKEKVFFHRNRSAIFLTDALKHKVLFGKNYFLCSDMPCLESFRKEASKSLSILSYVTKKEIINNHHGYDEMKIKRLLKKVIVAAKCALSFNGIIVNSMKDIVSNFNKHFSEQTELVKIINYAAKNIHSEEKLVEETILKKVVKFIDILDSLIFSEYSEIHNSTIKTITKKDFTIRILKQKEKTQLIYYISNKNKEEQIMTNYLPFNFIEICHKVETKNINSLKNLLEEIKLEYEPFAVIIQDRSLINQLPEEFNNIILLPSIVNKRLTRDELKGIKEKNILIIKNRLINEKNLEIIIKDLMIENNVKILDDCKCNQNIKIFSDIRVSTEVIQWLTNLK